MTAVTIRPARVDDAPRIREFQRMIAEASLPIIGEVRSNMLAKDAVGESVNDSL